MNTLTTIVPIFILIVLGWGARKKGYMPPEFLGPANRLVYQLAIPALIFRAISGKDFHTQFSLTAVTDTLLAILIVFFLSWVAGVLLRAKGGHRGTFIQTSIHGNLGYIGLAVVYYYLGQEGFARAGIIAGFIMLLQNFLGVLALQVNSGHASIRGNIKKIILSILGNPVIISAVLGIIFSLAGIPLPVILDRSIEILSNLALPMALLIIGASLSFEKIRPRMVSIFTAALFKLMVLPALGFALYLVSGLSPEVYLPGLILLASPTATVTFVMANEMKGDPDFAVAAISASTLLSAITFTVWLNFAG